jgi:hypothetical protein
MTAENTDTDAEAALPDAVIDRAETLTRRARRSEDDREASAYRDERDELLSGHDYTARVRDEDAVLVLYPSGWMADGTVQLDRVDDVDRGIEIPLDGPGADAEWDDIDRHNREIAETVAAEHGDVHGANAAAFAEYMSNHHAKLVESTTEAERTEFLQEYYPRNVWPTDEQRAVVSESVRLVVESARATGRRQ